MIMPYGGIVQFWQIQLRCKIATKDFLRKCFCHRGTEAQNGGSKMYFSVFLCLCGNFSFAGGKTGLPQHRRVFNYKYGTIF